MSLSFGWSLLAGAGPWPMWLGSKAMSCWGVEGIFGSQVTLSRSNSATVGRILKRIGFSWRGWVLYFIVYQHVRKGPTAIYYEVTRVETEAIIIKDVTRWHNRPTKTLNRNTQDMARLDNIFSQILFKISNYIFHCSVAWSWLFDFWCLVDPSNVIDRPKAT